MNLCHPRTKRPLSAEIMLAAACCRPGDSGSAKAAIRLYAARVDWALFSGVIQRHRVEPLVARALRDAQIKLPHALQESLNVASDRTIEQNLRFAFECKRILQAFEDEGLTPLFIKGITLAKIAYDNIAVKRGWDIDILVPEDQALRASTILQQLHYECILPRDAEPNQLRRWFAMSKEAVWRRRDDGVYVELHTRLVDNRLLLQNPAFGRTTQLIEVTKGICLPTLCEDDLFAYLCVHGASSAWFRLKWLADLANFLGRKTPSDIGRLFHESQRLGAGRAAAQALLLSRTIFRVELPWNLLQQLRSSSVNRMLAQNSIYLLDGGRADVELESRWLRTLPIHIAQFFLLPGLRFKFSELKRQSRVTLYHMTHASAKTHVKLLT